MSMAYVAVAAVVISAAATGYSIYSNEQAKDEAKDLAARQAADEKAAADAEAKGIRERAARLKATQSASLAASGVKLESSGTSGALMQETDRLAEQDALAVLKGGASRAEYIKRQGSITAKNYDRDSVAAGLNFASSALSAGTSYARATEGSRTAKTMNSQPAAKRYSLLGDT